ncbi:MAG: argininosuccinate lyase [Zetaproteobacteria bacterium CG_4_10_14_0_2_um_filter_55_20]|nr:MAG: argininosuccinate lyase [Zetaproteobacteria bacterium CG1_02_55_237]PIS18530.1 MAG: argininosuccinate lyase [Zetaproteobacteria bacterium CG08_land_8_20_14_0_20_55_17]PIY53912.1 MAG: argininosuccinate lyase [Zetaproteobacteria bacterium CG_4_10_14_0_8_um_filter_55_43]PIZ39357.1 MAG: argininosuccinate lyase [Zetaproteobacteria bacterium CG_4_10_14_0_2_um_filter_55_20]PJB80712.1 MAG: argininosuccinate lyase [Zetaproteobacteria bacterium CG_4_9_14_0_8_um_filter_55_31]
MAKDKLWGGRFNAPTNEFVEQFNASIDVDGRMFREDIAGSRAHARMLGQQGILSDDDVQQILSGLNDIEKAIEAGEIPFTVALEDVHMNIEARLTEKIGDAGKRLHTARSRNDQVTTDTRLFLRRRVDEMQVRIHTLQGVLVNLARSHADTIMPGFTHLQTAQPVTLGHHLLAYVEMLARDSGRFADARARMNQCPLGSAALAGTSFPIDRAYTAKKLGFDAPCANSLDAVSDRDFVLELLAACSICAVHLSRLSEEVILWMSAQFRFIDLPDAFCTGSSIMPQKKNPDMPELVRGKTGGIIGGLVAMLCTVKALPLAYNKDMQEDKGAVFDAFDQLEGCLRVFADMLPGMQVNKERMRNAAASGFSTATDLADALVRAGIPFREAHEIVGRSVAWCIEHDIELHQMDAAACAAIDHRLKKDMTAKLSVEACVAARNHIGGTAPEQVRAQCDAWKNKLEAHDA